MVVSSSLSEFLFLFLLCFTCRVCVCSLLPILYKVKQAMGDMEMVIEMYDELCKDSVPMIRKAAISVIPEFIKVMDVCDGCC